MYMSETVSEKWKSSVMEHDDLPEIKDTYKRDVTLRLVLENQEKFLQEAAPTVSAAGMPDTRWSC